MYQQARVYNLFQINNFYLFQSIISIFLLPDRHLGHTTNIFVLNNPVSLTESRLIGLYVLTNLVSPPCELDICSYLVGHSEKDAHSQMDGLLTFSLHRPNPIVYPRFFWSPQAALPLIPFNAITISYHVTAGT